MAGNFRGVLIFIIICASHKIISTYEINANTVKALKCQTLGEL